MRLIFFLTLSCALTGVAWSADPPKEEPASKSGASHGVPELMDAVRESIVTVMQIGRGGGQDALGTGFVVSQDGLIATNQHVIGNARRIQVRFSDGKTEDVKEVHATDPKFDLALIKVSRKGLTPLPLGNSDKVKQGQPVVAIGHPQGLEYSVVEGVISATREVENAKMLQLAIPIEEGNSGGPLLDLQGNVQGILTLKSAITHNLGFAHTVNDLKLLIEKPNPISMSRWLTIGRLDAQRWEPVMGGHWTQHVGIIQVEGMGQGFGGRTICLNKDGAPGLPFEVSVKVKLDSEDGAAGLIFCADGRDRHYGFYPSGGQLRLTRFEGPDLFSWKVLSEVPSPAYLSGEWNTLRVHVDEDRIRCFVNDQQVIELEDAELRGGKVGLCKFRQTNASFKSFRTGVSLQDKQVPETLAASLQEELDLYLQKPAKDKTAPEKLLAEPAAVRRLLEDRTKALELQVEKLRSLEKAVHRQAIAREMVRLLQRPADQTELLHAALLVAKHDNPDVDVDGYLQMMERMQSDLHADPEIKKGSLAAAKRLAAYLFEESGFHGTRGESIDDFSNSYMNEVLDDREGIPISLSIVYLELARRLGLNEIQGAGLPGRFMVSVAPPAPQEPASPDANTGKGITYIDVFNGGKFLSQSEAEQFIFQTTGQTVEDEQRVAATPRAMILRLLFNLTSFAKQPEQALPYLDLILAIDPDAYTERLNRALLRIRARDHQGAKEDLQALLEAAPAELDLQKIDTLYHSL